MADKNTRELIEDYTETFLQLMLDILQRRFLFRAFEKSIIGKNRSVVNNTFVKFYFYDYIRSQLTDLRKFFETDGRSYKMSFIFDHMTDKTVSQKHADISENRWKNDKQWGVSLEELANKTVMHKDIDNFASEIYKNHLDNFIDNLNTFLDELVGSLMAQNFEVNYFSLRSPDSNFLKYQLEDEFNEYLKIATN